MIDYGSNIFFNGKNSEEFGLFINPHGEFKYPKRKTNKIEIPGSNRSIVTFDGYEDVEEEFDMMLLPDESRSIRERAFEVIGWLYGTTQEYTRFEYSEEPNHFRLGYYDGDGEREDRFGVTGLMKANFVFRPERFLKIGEDKGSYDNPSKICGTLNYQLHPSSNNEIYNPTQYYSKPLIRILKPNFNVSEVTATINSQYTITISKADMPENGVVIDCETGNAFGYDDNTLDCNSITSFGSKGIPVLRPKLNRILGSAQEIYIVPRWYVY